MNAETLKQAIDEICRVTSASAEACEGERWTGHDFTEEQDAHYPGPTDDAIAEILNAVIDGRLVLASDNIALQAEVDRLREEHASWGPIMNQRGTQVMKLEAENAKLRKVLATITKDAQAVAKAGKRTNADWSRLRASMLMARTALNSDPNTAASPG